MTAVRVAGRARTLDLTIVRGPPCRIIQTVEATGWLIPLFGGSATVMRLVLPLRRVGGLSK